MSYNFGRSRSSRIPENWHPAQDYWIYFPTNNVSDYPPVTVLNPRGGQTIDPRWSFEERSTTVPNYGSASLPPPAPPPRLLLLDDYNPYTRSATPFIPAESPPTYFNQRSTRDESKLSEEEQKQALNKLRKQLYNPHMANIIKRLGNKSGSSAQHDDDGKRCAVCLEDFESKQFVTITPCDHMFHEECIVPWVKSEGKCPVCRFVFVEKSDDTSGVGIDGNLMSLIRAFNI